MLSLQLLHLVLQLLIVMFLLLSLSFSAVIIYTHVWHPYKLGRRLLTQRLRGPPPKFMLGNMHQVSQMRDSAYSQDMRVGDHDLLPRICPHFSYWSSIYGRRFLFWWGVEPRITVVEPELIKEILITKADYFGKSWLQKKGGVLLLGNGMVYANGESWAHRRRMVGPAFHVEQLKRTVPEMVVSTRLMVERWREMVAGGGGGGEGTEGEAEIDINYYLSVTTAEVIARTAFGSGHEKGTRVFRLLTSLQKVFAQSNRYLWLPCSKMLPTAINKKAWRIKSDIERALEELVQERRTAAGSGEHKSYGSDFLGLMLSESDRELLLHRKRKRKFTKGGGEGAAAAALQTSELVEECKTIFFTGHETTSSLLTWTLMLLALHPDWQDKGRAEVLDILPNGQAPDSDHLCRMKTLGMILNETLRLYPPAPALVRESLADLELGGMSIPRGTTFWIPILAIHHSQEVWGEDAKQFNPRRFSDGVARACKQQTEFMPFSLGPRACLGQTFAMMEAKLILSMILQSFKFSISPNYRHAPVTAITLKPKYGMPLIVSRV